MTQARHFPGPILPRDLTKKLRNHPVRSSPDDRETRGERCAGREEATPETDGEGELISAKIIRKSPSKMC